jgi:hypothetical protein
MPKWKKFSMEQAVQRVRSKELSLNKAAKIYGIPVATLHWHVHTTSRPIVGRPTTLTYTDEKEIVYACQVGTILYTSHTQNALFHW